LLLVLISPAAPAQPLAVRSATLRNGMKVLIAENHHIPRAAMHLFYKVGSRNEQPGITGISHFLEHMMFSGAAKYGRGEFDRQMEQQGGNDNAYTTADMTVYTDWFPSSELEHVMDMEADRMVNTRFDPEAIEAERPTSLIRIDGPLSGRRKTLSAGARRMFGINFGWVTGRTIACS
jgi:predicted Zn-dependent peptidase